jgi:pseudouridine-5'-phosphate glycosidase
VAVAQCWAFGATTVSGAIALADAAGISVFATGGVGGVHRGAEVTGDVSADLDAVAHHPLITVCAGAKAFLDLPRTLEELERLGVPVLGWRHDWFPAFYTRSSGLRVPHRAESADEVAAVLLHRSRPDVGVLLAVPIPIGAELDPDTIEATIASALSDAVAAGVTGAAVTPFVLERIAAVTGGDSVAANLALAEHNAGVAAAVAVSVAPIP